MSSGRNKSKAPEINAPKPVKKIEFTTPGGDRYVSESTKSSLALSSLMSPQSQDVIGESLRGMSSLARELNQPDVLRQEVIRQRSQDFYDLQARNINEVTDDVLSKTRSDLGQRFGGAYNATFGTDLLSKIERDRGTQLADARKQADLLGEDLKQNDENSRMQRFAMFHNYLGDLANQAQGFGSLGMQTLSQERSRATDLAIARAQMVQQADAQNAARRGSRSALLGMLAGGAATLLTGGLGAPAFAAAAAGSMASAGTSLFTR